MNILRTLPSPYSRSAKCCLVLVGLLFILTGCSTSTNNSSAASPQFTPEASNTATSTPTFTPTPVVWNTFAPPSIDPVTQVPPAASRLTLPEDVKVWLFLGSDQNAPYKGRTQAFHLLLVNQRLSKASLISLPGTLFVYIPGQTMQRLNTAYALGGMELVSETLAYNFGIKPDRFVVAHPGEFKWLVDDLGGLEVSVLFPIPDACGGLPAGLHTMNGEKAYCYVSYLSGQDEIDRTRRQQQVLQLLFTKLVQNGRLAQVPVLYASYQNWIETNFSLDELLEQVPMFLRLGDPQRVNYFLVGWGELQEWELPDNTQTRVLLPDQAAVAEIFNQALEAVLEPAPLGEIVLTYEAQLTAAVALTQTNVGTSRPTPTRIMPTLTPRATTGPAATPTLTPVPVPTAIIPTLPYPIVTLTPLPYP